VKGTGGPGLGHHDRQSVRCNHFYASVRDVFLFLVDNNVHNRLSVNEVSRIYTRAGHQAASAEDRAVTSRLATLSTALGAAVVVVSTIAVRPAPRLFGTPPKVCRSVFTGCTPMADLLSASLSRSSRLNLWQHSSQIAAICRAAFLKPVLALPRQTVCRDQLAVTVDKIEMGAARSHDRSGRPLSYLAGLSRHRRRRGLPHEPAVGGLVRRAIFRRAANERDHRNGGAALDRRGGMTLPQNCRSSVIPLSVKTRTILPSRREVARPSRAAALQGGGQAGAPALHPLRPQARWQPCDISGRYCASW
jgi:hypothetical protein